MSLNQSTSAEPDDGGSRAPTITPYSVRETNLGQLPISRALPIRERRIVGPWCFLDTFGPLSFEGQGPMQVPPHPHIGLQTVTWLLEGEVLHNDSLGFQAVVSPGGVNVMTTGQGIAHAEETPQHHSSRLSGVQLWVALPEAHRHVEPTFTHLAQVPKIELSGGLIQLFAGTYEGATCPATYYSETIGMEVQLVPNQRISLALKPKFEHAILVMEGDGSIEGQSLAKKTLYYFGACRDGIEIRSQVGGRFLLIGVSPFPEKILMWWNFVARTPDEIRLAREGWQARRRFGDVQGTELTRLSAPDMRRFAQPNPAS